MPFSKGGSAGELSADNGATPLSRLSARSVLLPTEAGRGRHRRPAPLGERKTCLQVAFLIGSPVKSAFALLLTRVTEPRTVKFWRLEVIKCKER